jgi:hypothetical protein
MRGPGLLWGYGRLVAPLVAVAVATVSLALPAPSAAASAPSVGPLTVKEQGSETAEAEIKAEGSRTEYQFWLEGPRKGPFCESPSSCGPAAELVGSGYVEASVAEEPVSVKLTGLESSSWYTARVIARNGSGATEAQPLLFKTGLPLPVQTFNTYERPNAEGGSWAEQAGRLRVEEAERERRQASERAAREASERELAATPPAPQCRVPRLKGDTLRTAHAVLRKAHCQLGRVRRPKHGHGQLVVSGQSPVAGAKLDVNAPIAVTLGLRAASRTVRPASGRQ